MKTYAAALFGAVVIGAPAFAGGPVTAVVEPVIEPAPVVTVVTGGDWGGAYAGAHLGYADVNVGTDGNGAIGGLQAGYRWDLGTAVLGAEIDASASNVSFDGSDDTIDSIARLKLQAGYDMGRTLVYLTGGAAYAKADIGGTSYSDTGYFGGIGMDYALNESWTVGGEILQHKFSDFDGTGLDPDATTAAVRVNYRF